MKKMKFVLLSLFIMLIGSASLQAALTYSPPSPRTGETVKFSLTPSSPPAGQISWNFGDGSPVQTGASLKITHVYAVVGSYTATASYFTLSHGQVDRATVVVTNTRQISFSPPQPKAGQAVVFTAQNFFSACIRWDFGDGVIKNGAVSESHTYAAAGNYSVRAYEECGTTYGAVTSVAVTQQDGEPPPPTTPSFAVTIVNLYFTGGKADVRVAKDFAPLQAYADIQVTGSGILQWQWLVDGMAVRADTMAVSFGDKFTLDSGKVPGLPTAVPGRHQVTLRFQNPKTDFTIPAITYFVGLRGPAPVILRVTPSTLAPGAEYMLEIEVSDLTPDTEILFPAPLAMVKKANILSPTRAQVIVFVAPTAAAGKKLITVKNEYGESSGPGQVTIASPHEGLQDPNRPAPLPQPLLCPDIAIAEIKVTLVSTQLGDPSADIPHDTVRLEITLENAGNKEVTSLFIIDLFVKRNGEKIFAAGDPNWSTRIGAPGSRFVVEGITDSFPHGVETTYSVEASSMYNECTTANNQASLTIDETLLHPGGTPDLTLNIFMVEKRWYQEGDQFKGTCYFSADVTNIGSGYCGDGSRTVDLEFIRVQGNRILAFIRIPENELPGPGASKRFSVEVPDSQEPPGVTPVVAFVNPAHNETNKANNWATNGATLDNDLESPLKSSARISFPPWGMLGRVLYVRFEIRNLKQQPLQNLRLILRKNGEKIKEWKSVALSPGGSSGSAYHTVVDRPLLENSSGADEFKVILTTNNDKGLPPDNTVMDSRIRPLKWMDLDNSIVQAMLQDLNTGIGATMEKEDENIRIYSAKTKTSISPESFYVYIEGKKKKWGMWHEFQASVWLKVHARNGQIAAEVIDKKLTLGSEAEKVLIAIFLPGIGYGIQHGIEKALVSAIPNNLGIGGLPVSPCGIVLRDGALYLYYPYAN